MAATRARIGCGELPEQPALEELRAASHRFEQQGSELGVRARRGLELGTIHLDDLGGAVGDGLLLLRRDESAECPFSERPIAEESAAAEDQPDEPGAVDARVKHLDISRS